MLINGITLPIVEDIESPRQSTFAPIIAYFREHIELLRQLAPEAKARVRACAAKLLNYFQRWQDWKRPLYNGNDWIYQPLRILREEFAEEHSLHVIREAIALLDRLGLIERRQNLREKNYRNGQDRTYQYRVRVDFLLKLLSPQEPTPQTAETPVTIPFVNFEQPKFNPEERTFSSEKPTFTVERYTQQQCIKDSFNTSTTNNTAAVQFEKVQEEEIIEETKSDDTLVPLEIVATKALGIELNPQLERIIRESSAEVVIDAVEYVKSKEGKVKKSKAGYLVSAIKGKFKLEKKPEVRKPQPEKTDRVRGQNPSNLPEGFEEEYQRGIEKGIFQDIPARLLSYGNNQPIVALASGERLFWYDARRRFFEELAQTEEQQIVEEFPMQIGDWVQLKEIPCQILKINQGLIPSIDVWNPDSNEIVMGVLIHQIDF